MLWGQLYWCIDRALNLGLGRVISWNKEGIIIVCSLNCVIIWPNLALFYFILKLLLNFQVNQYIVIWITIQLCQWNKMGNFLFVHTKICSRHRVYVWKSLRHLITRQPLIRAKWILTLIWKLESLLTRWYIFLSCI